MTDLRVVVDTSVAVSALLFARSTPRKAFDLAARTGVLLLSEATLAELDDVLRRPKFDKYVSEQQRLEFLSAFVDRAEIVTVADRIQICRDMKDDKFLELAAAGNASHLLSGDADLLHLDPFRGTRIVTASDFLAAISTS